MTNNSSSKESATIYQKRLKSGFNYLFLKKGFSYEFTNETGNLLIFVHSGRVRVLIGKYKEYFFSDREMFLIKNAGYQFDTLQNTKLVLLNQDNLWVSFYENLRKDASMAKDKYIFSISSLVIQPKLEVFLDSVIQSLINNKGCSKNYQHMRQRELETLLKKCYSKKVLINFFSRLSGDVQDFYQFIFDNYQKYRGVEELITASKLSPSTFNRKFRELFGESPYQWILGKRSEIIYRKLVVNNCPIVKIMTEYDFTDASHFNRFCKMMYGYSPTELRRRYKQESEKLPVF
ncbi:MAG: AraC family transcriptional regulator [Rikenellaceae bacterium]